MKVLERITHGVAENRDAVAVERLVSEAEYVFFEVYALAFFVDPVA